MDLSHRQFMIVLTSIMLVLSCSAGARSEESIVIGQKMRLQSALLEKEIQLSVHIPDDYDVSEEIYPVLYTFQTHFQQVAGAVKSLYDYGLTPKAIVVRIDNYEFGYLSPTKIESDPNSGKADLFLRFFEEELFPFIDSSYRTHPYRVVFSNSWGAMFAAYAVLAHPGIFNAAIASIPWVRYDGENKFLINNTERFIGLNEYDNFLYMTMDDESEIIPDLEAFLEILRDNPEEGLEWEYHHWPEEDHSSTPYRSVYTGLRALFGAWNGIPPGIVSQGLGAIREYEASLDRRFHYGIGISPAALRRAGQERQRNGDLDEAISIFKYFIEKRPKDPFGHVTLGRAYEEKSDLRSAREAYAKAYQLATRSSHPQVKWVKGFLDRIDKKIESGGR